MTAGKRPGVPAPDGRLSDGHRTTRPAGAGPLVGERYSIADIGFYAYTHVAHEGEFELARHPGVRTWLDRVRSQPGHITIDA